MTTLPGMEGARASGDALGRYYTPLPLARLIVARRLAELRQHLPALAIPYAVEPSCGGGAFVGALLDAIPCMEVHAIDADPRAAGLAMASRGDVGDFLTLPLPRLLRPDLIIGNPPFGDIPAHIGRSLWLRPRMVSLILPLDRLGRPAMKPLFFGDDERDGGLRLASVEVIHPRPWPAHVRETACYTWLRAHDGPAVLGEPLVWR
jgi:hypothetical protein